eukprot:gene24371-9981_t
MASVQYHIPRSAEHAGAGSFSVDGGLTSSELARLRQLWSCLDAEQHGGSTMASESFSDREAADAAALYGGVERTYVCDSEGWVRSLMVKLLDRALDAGLAAEDYGKASVFLVLVVFVVVVVVYGGVELTYVCDSEDWVRSLMVKLLDRALDAGLAAEDYGWVRSLMVKLLDRALDAGLAAEDYGEALPRLRFLHYSHPGASMAPHVDLAKREPGDPKSSMSSRTFLLYLDSCGSGGETVLLEREGPTIEASGLVAAVRPLGGRLLVFPHKCPHAGAPVGENSTKLLLRGELY